MNKSFFTLTLISLFFVTLSAQESKGQNNDPVGSWKFDAPYAPEGYTSGNIAVAFAEKKYSATMMFTGSDYKIPGQNVKFMDDTLLFSVYIEGQEVKVALKFAEPLKMAGKAVYSEGEVLLSLTKESKIR